MSANIKTWQERRDGNFISERDARDAEIADLRAENAHLDEQIEVLRSAQPVQAELSDAQIEDVFRKNYSIDVPEDDYRYREYRRLAIIKFARAILAAAKKGGAA